MAREGYCQWPLRHSRRGKIVEYADKAAAKRHRDRLKIYAAYKAKEPMPYRGPYDLNQQSVAMSCETFDIVLDWEGR